MHKQFQSGCHVRLSYVVVFPATTPKKLRTLPWVFRKLILFLFLMWWVGSPLPQPIQSRALLCHSTHGYLWLLSFTLRVVKRHKQKSTLGRKNNNEAHLLLVPKLSRVTKFANRSHPPTPRHRLSFKLRKLLTFDHYDIASREKNLRDSRRATILLVMEVHIQDEEKNSVQRDISFSRHVLEKSFRSCSKKEKWKNSYNRRKKNVGEITVA